MVTKNCKNNRACSCEVMFKKIYYFLSEHGVCITDYCIQVSSINNNVAVTLRYLWPRMCKRRQPVNQPHMSRIYSSLCSKTLLHCHCVYYIFNDINRLINFSFGTKILTHTEPQNEVHQKCYI